LTNDSLALLLELLKIFLLKVLKIIQSRRDWLIMTRNKQNKKLRNSTSNMVERLNNLYQNNLLVTMNIWAQESPKLELWFKRYKGLKFHGPNWNLQKVQRPRCKLLRIYWNWNTFVLKIHEPSPWAMDRRDLPVHHGLATLAGLGLAGARRDVRKTKRRLWRPSDVEQGRWCLELIEAATQAWKKRVGVVQRCGEARARSCNLL
jgi:hypothetical protein